MYFVQPLILFKEKFFRPREDIRHEDRVRMAFDILKLSTMCHFYLQFSWIPYSRGYIICLMTQSKTSCILFSTKWRLHNVASELWGQLTQLELSGENIHLLLFPLSLAIFPKHLFNIQYALCIDLSYKFSWSRLFSTCINFIKAYITVDPRVIAIKRI